MQTKDAATDHDFTLVMDGIYDLTDEAVEALFEAGCDDCVPTVRSCRVYFPFERSASTLKDAILSAIRDVEKAGIGGSVIRVDHSNLVTQAEIARKLSVTRQMVHEYVMGEHSTRGFPAPMASAGDASVWSWAEVAEWLQQNGMIEETIAQDARAVAIINSMLQLRHHHATTPTIVNEIRRSLESRNAGAPKHSRSTDA